MTGGFYAMISRMHLIQRWSLMRNSRPENVQEHSLQVAVLAHALALLRRRRADAETIELPDPEHVMALAIFHDASEILTGDMPTPIKYLNRDLSQAYRVAESRAIEHLLAMLPPELRPDYEPLLRPASDDPLETVAWTLVKAADRLAALIKCIEEEAAGNREFCRARAQIEARLEAMELPEVNMFRERFEADFARSLDELQTLSEGEAGAD
ncbi:MAG: 5'-deoxynucleotidase [Bacillota bacterium]|nr:5'-deoxynucleotidase [Bacillota bacterium]